MTEFPKIEFKQVKLGPPYCKKPTRDPDQIWLQILIMVALLAGIIGMVIRV